jgi:hypothetical protein
MAAPTCMQVRSSVSYGANSSWYIVIVHLSIQDGYGFEDPPPGSFVDGHSCMSTASGLQTYKP